MTLAGSVLLVHYPGAPFMQGLSLINPWFATVFLVLLAATVWLFRVAAGKIFAVAMMMYGKEPTFREMWYWFRRAGGKREAA